MGFETIRYARSALSSYYIEMLIWGFTFFAGRYPIVVGDVSCDIEVCVVSLSFGWGFY